MCGKTLLAHFNLQTPFVMLTILRWIVINYFTHIYVALDGLYQA